MISTELIDRTIEIRNKLQTEVSIEQVCDDYDLSFNELFKLMKRYDKKFKKCNKPPLYITERNGQYFLRKNNVYYGSYYSFEDAKKVRDYFIFHGWNKRRLDEVCYKLGVKRVKKEVE